MDHYPQQLLNDFIKDLEKTKRIQFIPKSFAQLSFNYEKEHFQSDHLKNFFDIIQLLFESQLDEEQLKNSLTLMDKYGFQQVGQFQHYGPTKLKSLGINEEQITNLRSLLGKYVTENFDDSEKQFLSSSSTISQELEILKQNMKKLNQQNGFELFQYPLYSLKDIDDVENYRSIIVLGETGTGKTTFINYFINNYLEVSLQDDYRFLLIEEDKEQSEAVSNTKEVTAYYIKPFKEKLGIRIIDTPGYFDTKGVQWDLEITKKIEKCFKTEVDSLSTICFLIKSSTMRLSTSQNYILTSILQLFGKDVIQNFVFIFTFFDGSKEPQAINSLRFKGDEFHHPSPVVDILDKINEPWYLKLNNSSMNDDRQNPFTKIYWNQAIQCFNDLYVKKIIHNQQQTLKLTREVIEQREQISVIVIDIRQQISQQLNEIANIKQIQYHISQLNQQIEKQKISKQSQKLNKGYYTTNCTSCNQTCHYPCRVSTNIMKKKCAAMMNGKCQICKGKCSWDSHINQDFIITYKTEEKVQEVEEMKHLYVQGKIQKEKQKQMIDQFEQKLTILQAQCLKQQVELKKMINDLKQISLQDPVCVYQEQFAEIMIQQEMDTKKLGYQDRVKALMEMREFCITLRETEKSCGSAILTKEFLEKKLLERKKQNLQQIM